MKTSVIIPVGVQVRVEKNPSGWGEEYQCIHIEGSVVNVKINGDKPPEGCSIRIEPDGDLTITNYGGQYETLAPQNLHLKNSRPWKQLKPKKKS